MEKRFLITGNKNKSIVTDELHRFFQWMENREISFIVDE